MPEPKSPSQPAAATPDTPGAVPGRTSTAQGERQQEVPRMPHERDESTDSQAAMEPSQERVARKGAKDVARGVTDTSKGAELDATYDRLREGMPDGEKKFRP